MSIIEALTMVYTFIPREVLLMILVCLIMYPMLEYNDYKNRKQNGKK